VAVDNEDSKPETASLMRLREEMANKASEEARFYKAQADDKEIYIQLGKISLEKKIREDIEEKCANIYHHVYNFDEPVTSVTTRFAIGMMLMWDRLDPKCDMEFIFNSPGGSVVAGIALYDHIQIMRRKGHHITTGAVGMAASMAGFLVQAGDVRWMGQESWLMIHQASLVTMGKIKEVEDTTEWVHRVCDRVANIFVKRAIAKTGQDSKEAMKIFTDGWDRRDWWLPSDVCLELGYVDEAR
jgi:ATP-dependent Clp protease protease subunit